MMGFKKIISQGSFWKSVLWLGVTFLIIYNFISMMFEYGGIDFEAFFQERTENGKWIRFVIGQILAAFVYGFILAYGQFKMKQKKNSN